MRKTRLVILPTKCLHQMGFLLLFLSCPVIGDWGRIRPESENSHKAIQIDKEGTCGLQRDPPGKLLNFFYDDGSEQCELSEDIDSNGIAGKPIFGKVWRNDERRIDLQRVIRERNIREKNDERKDVRKTLQRVTDERRSVRRELQKGIHRDIREISQVHAKSSELRQPSKGRQQENEGATRRQMSISVRHISKENEIKSSERERFYHFSRPIRRQNDRPDHRRRSVREVTSEQRDNVRTIQIAQEIRGRQIQRHVRSAERERQGIRRDNNRRSVPNRSLRMREGDVAVTIRQIRERNPDRQTERLSLSRRKQPDIRRSTGNLERRLSQIRRIRITEIDGQIMERRMSRSENRPDNRKLSQKDIKEGRIYPLNDKMDRMMEIKSARVSTVAKPLSDNLILESKKADEKFFGGITKWMDFKKYESHKVGDWTTNCVIGAVVYFFSTRRIKAV